MNVYLEALRNWAARSLKAIVGAVVAAAVPVIVGALLELPDTITVPTTAAAVGASVYRTRNY